jgi:hypothetical protein
LSRAAGFSTQAPPDPLARTYGDHSAWLNGLIIEGFEGVALKKGVDVVSVRTGVRTDLSPLGALVAIEAGLQPFELREWLHAKIERRRGYPRKAAASRMRPPGVVVKGSPAAAASHRYTHLGGAALAP